MSDELRQDIERYLLDLGTWVSADVLCEKFGIDQRRLRGINGSPGLVSEFAISNTSHGYRHIATATTSEWLHFKHAMRRHGINELRRVQELDKCRHQVIRQTRRFMFEKDTGQGILLPACSHHA